MFTNSIIEKANISSRIPLRSATMRFWKPISNKIPRMISATVAVQANNGKSDFGTHGSKIPVYVIKFPRSQNDPQLRIKIQRQELNVRTKRNNLFFYPY